MLINYIANINLHLKDKISLFLLQIASFNHNG